MGGGGGGKREDRNWRGGEENISKIINKNTQKTPNTPAHRLLVLLLLSQRLKGLVDKGMEVLDLPSIHRRRPLNEKSRLGEVEVKLLSGYTFDIDVDLEFSKVGKVLLETAIERGKKGEGTGDRRVRRGRRMVTMMMRLTMMQCLCQSFLQGHEQVSRTTQRMTCFLVLRRGSFATLYLQSFGVKLCFKERGRRCGLQGNDEVLTIISVLESCGVTIELMTVSNCLEIVK